MWKTNAQSGKRKSRLQLWRKKDNLWSPVPFHHKSPQPELFHLLIHRSTTRPPHDPHPIEQRMRTTTTTQTTPVRLIIPLKLNLWTLPITDVEWYKFLAVCLQLLKTFPVERLIVTNRCLSVLEGKGVIWKFRFHFCLRRVSVFLFLQPLWDLWSSVSSTSRRTMFCTVVSLKLRWTCTRDETN